VIKAYQIIKTSKSEFLFSVWVIDYIKGKARCIASLTGLMIGDVIDVDFMSIDMELKDVSIAYKGFARAENSLFAEVLNQEEINEIIFLSGGSGLIEIELFKKNPRFDFLINEQKEDYSSRFFSTCFL
jgi:autonomous glycyl radical cofactor GrcA